MAKLKFVKMQGAGNDFVVLDNRSGQVPGDLSKFSALVADRKRGVGADGVLLVEPSSRKSFRMRYFNADGSEADMCGNGGRCIARFANAIGAVGADMEFENLAGDFKASVLPGGIVDLQMTQPHSMKLNMEVEVEGQLVVGHFLNTGVPHFVVPVRDIESAPVLELGRILRHHPDFGPKGTNVNFVQATGPSAISVRTYERGVEDETLACGTGSVAAAILMAALKLVTAPVAVKTHGGDILEIAFKLNGEAVSDVYLKGAAEISFEGELDLAQYSGR